MEDDQLKAHLDRVMFVGILRHRSFLSRLPPPYCSLLLLLGGFLAGCTKGPTQPGKEAQYKIAFDRTTDIYVMNADGSEETRLTHTDPFWSAYPVWSPDGMRIAFRSYRGGSVEIYTMMSDGTDEKRLTNLPQAVEKGGYVWSTDGTKLAFHADDGIHIVNSDGSNHRQLTHLNGNRNPAWSPDGSKITFSSVEGWDSLARSIGAIYVINADGTDPRRLTPDSVNAHFPLWLPDGHNVAWMRTKEHFFDIYLMNVDGSDYRQLTSDLNVTRISVSPDGTKIAFFHYVTLYVHDLYVVHVDGGDLRKLNPNGFHVDGGASISWSPDGNMIVFDNGYTFSGHPEDYGMYIAASGGNHLRYVTKGGNPQWSPKSAR